MLLHPLTRCMHLVSKSSCVKLIANRRWLRATKTIYGLDYYTILGKLKKINLKNIIHITLLIIIK